MDLADGSKRQLTHSRYSEEAPSWSPDGRRIAYVHTRLIRVPGLAARQYMPHIAVIDVRTRSVRVLTGGNAYDGSPAWSPDGRRIAWARTTLKGNSTTVYSEIWVMRRGGGGARRLTHNRVGDFAPAWSPDGRLIAFTRYRGQDTEARGIWVMRRGGKGERRLVRNGSQPAWSPDGRRLAYGRLTAGCRAAAPCRT